MLDSKKEKELIETIFMNQRNFCNKYGYNIKTLSNVKLGYNKPTQRFIDSIGKYVDDMQDSYMKYVGNL